MEDKETKKEFYRPTQQEKKAYIAKRRANYIIAQLKGEDKIPCEWEEPKGRK